MDMKPWIKRVSGGASINAVAKASGIPQPTLDGQLRSSTGVKPDAVVKIARAYDVSPVVALVEYGLIRADEAGQQHDLAEADHLTWLSDDSRATDEILLAEIGRRMEARKSKRPLGTE